MLLSETPILVPLTSTLKLLVYSYFLNSGLNEQDVNRNFNRGEILCTIVDVFHADKSHICRP